MIMNYINYFGDIQEQVQSLEEIEKQLLIRKAIMVASFSDVLKERDIELLIHCGKELWRIDFEVIKKGYQNPYGINNLFQMIMYDSNYGLEKGFLDIYGKPLEVLLSLEEMMKVENISSIQTPFKIRVDSASDCWLKLMFEACGKRELHALFSQEVMSKELKVNTGVKKFPKV